MRPPVPTLIRGAKAIADRLGFSAATVASMHQRGLLPTFRVGGTPYATPAALDEWRALYVEGKIPTE